VLIINPGRTLASTLQIERAVIRIMTDILRMKLSRLFAVTLEIQLIN